MANMPVPLTADELSRVLHGLADAVAAGDSLEGSFEYLLAYEDPHDCEEGPCPHLMVRAAYRVGNRRGGQGGMEFIGKFREIGAGA